MAHVRATQAEADGPRLSSTARTIPSTVAQMPIQPTTGWNSKQRLHAPAQRPLRVITDSQYLINGITKWVKGWQKNDWKTREGQPVENRDLWELLITVNGPQVSWQHVKGHAGHPLNERANTLAQQQAGSGTGSRLSLPTHAATARTTPPTGFPCYLSLIGSNLQRHATWESCQRTVHGVSGAKFKKVANQQQFDAQLQLWKVRG